MVRKPSAPSTPSFLRGGIQKSMLQAASSLFSIFFFLNINLMNLKLIYPKKHIDANKTPVRKDSKIDILDLNATANIIKAQEEALRKKKGKVVTYLIFGKEKGEINNNGNFH